MKKSEQVTLEQLQALTDRELASILVFMTGYAEKSPKFQEALAAGYRSVTETPEQRKARWAAMRGDA